MIQQGLDFDDVLIIPRPSTVNSRNSVNLAQIFENGKLNMKIPIIASPMKGIVGTDLIINLTELGGFGILHRFFSSDDERLDNIRTLDKALSGNFGVAVRLNELSFIKSIIRKYEPAIVCVDVANGYLDCVSDYVKRIRSYIDKYKSKTLIMAGNVATRDGAQRLFDSGATLIRIGIGSGHLCTTRNVTGVGVPQITAIMECSNAPWIKVADGGIRNSGDIVKSLVAGADLVMIGSLFANAYESSHNGSISGMASRAHQEEFYGEVIKSVEGISLPAQKRTSLKSLVDDLVWGIKSAFTYINCESMDDLSELRKSSDTFIMSGSGSIKKGY